jgi:SAM-dependent methyltransferase
MGFGLGIHRLGAGIRPRFTKLGARVPGLQDALLRIRPREKVFGKAYSKHLWGSTESYSGEGSELGATEELRSYLPKLFERLDIKSFLDAPCGDWNWMRKVDLTKVDYIGADVVPSVIKANQHTYGSKNVRFVLSDITRDQLPGADLVLCRDCLVHLSFEDIHDVIENIRSSGSKYLLVSDSPHVRVNENKITGLDWRHLNLSLPPFSFPGPIERVKDHYASVPFYISLWRIEDLPRRASPGGIGARL